MKLNFKIILFLVCSIVAFSSCQTAMLYTTLDILHPAKVTFSPDAERILIMNNSVVQPADVGHTIRSFYSSPQNVRVATDSVSLFCLSVLADEMKDTGFFSSVDLILTSLNSDRDFNSITPLQPFTVKRLCDEYDVDAVLALDRIVVNDEIAEYYYKEWEHHECILGVKYETFWSIHYPDKLGALAVHFKDSLLWESESSIYRKAFDGLPDRQDAIIDGALYVGQNSVKRFVPYWEQSDRYFYAPNNKLMKQGMDSVYIKDWNGAIDSWKKVFYQTGNPKLKAQAGNNIAIACEILGDYNEALKYAKSAYDILSSQLLMDAEAQNRLIQYMMDLLQRAKDVELLKEQLGEE
ncbi:hypothetical protein D0T49_04020 [Paludibacter sp. 221]|uniref:DUF6340 family protein n=1 Tax=Paludibacter sp. 221 TaxID=2302939 RepID=UPI0013D77FE4|nr:DUF6340 family protein [Paludibacter sp. 221]NDV46207.1 hypothetical protein [Paludibacter sp. 221]